MTLCIYNILTAIDILHKKKLFGPVYSTEMAIMPINKCGGLPGCTQQTEQGQRKIQNPDG